MGVNGADALRPGDPVRLGPYQLLGRLGEGGQGVVYLANRVDGGNVAVKLLHADVAENAAARQRFIREAELVKRVASFCTAQVIDASVDGDQPYIVSEYIPGPSLRKVVGESGPIQGGGLERLAIGTATAMVAVHRAGVVHRDFKPHNILMGPDGPRVIDFGIARELDNTTITSKSVGTPAFMAPEQLLGSGASPASDIFAWAGTMMYAATGRAPFGQDSIPAVMNRIMHAEPDLRGVPPALRDVVSRCLDKDPVRRPRAREVLMALLGQEDVVAAAESPAPVAGAPLAAPVGFPTEMLAQARDLAATQTPPGNATAYPNPAPTEAMGAAGGDPVAETADGPLPSPAGARRKRRYSAALLSGSAVAAAAAVAALAFAFLPDGNAQEGTRKPPAPTTQQQQPSSPAPTVTVSKTKKVTQTVKPRTPSSQAPRPPVTNDPEPGDKDDPVTSEDHYCVPYPGAEIQCE